MAHLQSLQHFLCAKAGKHASKASALLSPQCLSILVYKLCLVCCSDHPALLR